MSGQWRLIVGASSKHINQLGGWTTPGSVPFSYQPDPGRRSADLLPQEFADSVEGLPGTSRELWVPCRPADLGLSRITAGSRIPGTRRSYQVTGGHEGAGSRVHEVPCGAGRTLEDMQPRRFGTVRAPGSNPGPPTIFVFDIGVSGRCHLHLHAAGSQFSAELSQPRGAVVTVVRRSELLCRQSVAAQRFQA